KFRRICPITPCGRLLVRPLLGSVPAPPFGGRAFAAEADRASWYCRKTWPGPYFVDLASEKHQSPLSVRRNSSPSVEANEALVGWVTDLVASTSYLGLARRTKTSPAWFGT